MDDFRFEVRGVAGLAVVAELQGVLSSSAARGLGEIVSRIRAERALGCALDLHGLEGLDGAGLLEFGKFCVLTSIATHVLHVFGLRPELRKLLGKLGFRTCLRFHSSEAAALRATKGAPVVGDLDPSEVWGGISPQGWLDLGQAGPPLVGPLEGFGELWHKVYRLRLPGAATSADEAARAFREHLPDLWPPGNRLTFPPGGPVPGAVARIVLGLAGGLPLHTGALVLHADARSFTLGSLAGHIEAGWIHLCAGPEGGDTVIQVQSLGRGGDPLFEAGLRLFGHGQQEKFWRTTLERTATHFGVPAELESSTSRIDETIRWEAAPNVLHSAALTAPLALVGDALGARVGTEEGAARSTEAGRRPERRTILILGGGYGGLACLRTLAGRLSPVHYRIRLVDATPYHTIKTRFHERAVMEGREALIRLPLSTLASASNAEFSEDEIVRVDLGGHTVSGRNDAYRYDLLVLALGGEIAYFGVDGAAAHTVSLQTYEQAVECCHRVAALRGKGSRRRVVVVGAGIEGLEVATMLRQEISTEHCEILVLDRGVRLMAQSQCGDSQREYVRERLERTGVALRLNATIQSVGEGHVVLEGGERLSSDLTVWCSGVVPVAVAGIPDPFRVGPDLQCLDHPGVFAVGDFATVESSQKAANLRSAQRAAYQGELAAENLCLLETGRPLKSARYRPVGELIALGDYDGVGVVFGTPLTGLRAALLKKAHEGKYLAETLQDVPGAVGRGLLAAARRGLRGG